MLAHEDRDADHFKFQGDITQSAAYIHGSDLWKKVTIRLGTDITRYLLESCSVFVAAPPSCVFQVCGVPVYDRVSAASSGFHLQRQFRKVNCSRFGRNRGLVILKRRHTVGSTAVSNRRKRRDERLNKRKRKRERGHEDGETVTCSVRKRRRLGHELKEEIQQVSRETAEERIPTSVGSTLSKKIAVNFKQPVEMSAAAVPLEVGPSWRAGTFPPLPASQCFIRTLGLLYGGRGMHGFLLNRKKKTADGSSRLQGKDLIRVVFFEGLPYLNGLERKPKKLPRRFFNMIKLFSQLLQQHRKCPYSKILQRLCPVIENSSAEQGELNSLLSKHCAPHRVYLFVRECLSDVIPPELWGSEHNRLNFFVRVRSFLHNGKFEKLSLAELLWKMKVNDCDWLKISKTGEILSSFWIKHILFCFVLFFLIGSFFFFFFKS